MRGFALVDKPVGPTSHDVVDAVRRALRTRKVGHAGTLDPPASGLVVVGVGPATRLLRFVQHLPKTYETTGTLGVRTSTLDAEGEVLSEQPVTCSEESLRCAVSELVGDIEQVPPAVSAVKVRGERAYRRAARGEDVELAPRPVTVYELELLGFEPPAFRLRARCSGGTYVRTLVADIGERLGCGAHVSDLRRTAIGSLDVAQAAPPDAVAPETVLAVEDGLRDLPQIEIDAQDAHRAGNGASVSSPEPSPPEGAEVLVRGPEGAVGIFTVRGGVLRPVTVLSR